MGKGTPLALDRDRRCQSLGAGQNTVEEAPRKVYCGDTAGEEDRERRVNTLARTRKQL